MIKRSIAVMAGALALAGLLTLSLQVGLEAKEKKVKAEQQGRTLGNWLDLRGETFICNSEGCALPVNGVLIGCNQEGCRPVTDIIVDAGAVKRVTPQIPPPEKKK